MNKSLVAMVFEMSALVVLAAGCSGLPAESERGSSAPTDAGKTLASGPAPASSDTGDGGVTPDASGREIEEFDGGLPA
jgi:hypothetical protein